LGERRNISELAIKLAKGLIGFKRSSNRPLKKEVGREGERQQEKENVAETLVAARW